MNVTRENRIVCETDFILNKDFMLAHSPMGTRHH
jgi:hypothetical protein